jgi:hypothetical protein
MSLTWFSSKRFCKGEDMIDSFKQIMIILIMIAPGYFCYSIKDMWGSYREKTQFEKLLNSLMYSTLLWLPFFIYVVGVGISSDITIIYMVKTSLIVFVLMIALIIILAWSISRIEQKKYIYIWGRKLKTSVKLDQGVPLMEYIFNDPKKQMSQIHIYTNDGCIYKGFNKDEKDREILTGAHPYSGDISFVCEWSKNSKGEKFNYDESELIDDQGHVLRTYIPKERIRKIRYSVKDKD